MTFEQVMENTRGVSSAPTFEDVECKALFDACLRVSPGGIVVEIGCQLGRSSSIIAQLQQVIQYHAIHIDPYTMQPDTLQGWIRNMWNLGDVMNHEFTLMCMRTAQAEWLLSRIGEIDLALVDGDHQYASVMTDLRLVGDRIKRGGYLAAHDYWNEGLHEVKRALDDYLDPKWHPIGSYGSLGVWLKI